MFATSITSDQRRSILCEETVRNGTHHPSFLSPHLTARIGTEGVRNEEGETNPARAEESRVMSVSLGSLHSPLSTFHVPPRLAA